MAKDDTFSAPGLRLQWSHDRYNGWRVAAWKPSASMVFTDRTSLLRFISWPIKTPTGDLIRGWLDAHIASVTDNLSADTATSESGTDTSLSAEVLATGFGPEVFAGELDPSDPNHATRMVV